MYDIEEITGSHSSETTGCWPSPNECAPDYWTSCSPDAPSGGCRPDVEMCAPDYGEDGCLPDCSPNND